MSWRWKTSAPNANCSLLERRIQREYISQVLATYYVYTEGKKENDESVVPRFFCYVFPGPVLAPMTRVILVGMENELHRLDGSKLGFCRQ